MRKIIEDAIERYELTEEQTQYLDKELDFERENFNSIELRPYELNIKGEQIYQALLIDDESDGALHICYL